MMPPSRTAINTLATVPPDFPFFTTCGVTIFRFADGDVGESNGSPVIGFTSWNRAREKWVGETRPVGGVPVRPVVRADRIDGDVPVWLVELGGEPCTVGAWLPSDADPVKGGEEARFGLSGEVGFCGLACR